jgi:hypothetical protein
VLLLDSLYQDIIMVEITCDKAKIMLIIRLGVLISNEERNLGAELYTWDTSACCQYFDPLALSTSLTFSSLIKQF